MGIAAAPLIGAAVGGLDGSSGAGGSILGRIGGTIQNGAQNFFGSLMDLFKGDFKGAAGKFIAGCFGAPPPGQTDQANQQFGTAAGSMFANPLQTTFAPMQSEVDDDDDDDDDNDEIKKKEAEDKMFRNLELNKIYSNNIAG